MVLLLLYFKKSLTDGFENQGGFILSGSVEYIDTLMTKMYKDAG